MIRAVDALVIAAWVGLPAMLIVVALHRLRRAGSRAVGAPAVTGLLVAFAAVAVVLTPTVATTLERTFAGHMVQHLVLGLLAPLLLVVGRLPELLPWALPAGPRRDLRRGVRALLRPPSSLTRPTIAMVGTWYLWHVPALYGAAVDHVLVHVVEHLSFLGVGTWFWAAVAPHRRRTGSSVLALFVTTIGMGFLGATLALSPEPFYAEHVAATSVVGQLGDQHLGGMLMWTPGGLVYLFAAVVQLIRWLDPGDAADTRRRGPVVPVQEVIR